ncbi:MAG: DUF3822 family protein [Muribaculaceae bacterium]|nr:DUF3822 family protein [Muribaculaceae bacterium]
MDTDQPLTPDLIDRHTFWCLAMELTPSAVEVMLTSTVEDNSLIYRRIPLPADIPAPHRALEEVIYRNPLLLSDFRSTHIILRPRHWAAIPDTVDPADTSAILWPDAAADNLSPLICPLKPFSAAALAMTDRSSLGLLRRTFSDAAISVHMQPLCSFITSGTRNSGVTKAFVNLGPESVDLIIYSGQRLQYINTFEVTDPSDAAYYILAAVEATSFDRMNHQMLISGPPSRREALMPLLRKYINYVMPQIFPAAALRSGREAMDAPFELTVLPLIRN